MSTFDSDLRACLLDSDLRACLLQYVSLKTTSRVDSVVLNGTEFARPEPAAKGQDMQHFEEWDFGQGTWIFAMILDGHGGISSDLKLNDAAEFIHSELPPLIKAAVAARLAATRSHCLPDADMAKILSDNLVALDDRIKDDVIAALADESMPNRDILLGRAVTGTTACVAVVDPSRRVHVANIGDSDCYLVSGTTKEAAHLTPHQSCTNPAEKQRILDEHPNESSSDLFHARRLFGRLIPSRGIGDFPLKLAAPEVKKLLLWMNMAGVDVETDSAVLHNHTPPYLSNKPDIIHVQANEGDFLVLASDGLGSQVWFMNDGDNSVETVGRVCAAGLVDQPRSGFNAALEIIWQAWLGVVDCHLYRLVVDKYSPSGRVDDIAIVVGRL
ncbi:Serine/threonine protein phosphatase 2C [Mycena indigotica]|uniref:Serine/threonine protein phosphatase 2C n=1 Tax=Mycena indigotica TaxID=2126181 RepID=A0A8H6WL04_9AGAR|nr:Serine/threonine protein phosphatase 2C [Mycena indigotica]KAF7316299.1 Serine/threonine protein phosphatase 2C [Mycena indigotica]